MTRKIKKRKKYIRICDEPNANPRYRVAALLIIQDHFKTKKRQLKATAKNGQKMVQIIIYATHIEAGRDFKG